MARFRRRRERGTPSFDAPARLTPAATTVAPIELRARVSVEQLAAAAAQLTDAEKDLLQWGVEHQTTITIGCLRGWDGVADTAFMVTMIGIQQHIQVCIDSKHIDREPLPGDPSSWACTHQGPGKPAASRLNALLTAPDPDGAWWTVHGLTAAAQQAEFILWPPLISSWRTGALSPSRGDLLALSNSTGLPITYFGGRALRINGVDGHGWPTFTEDLYDADGTPYPYPDPS